MPTVLRASRAVTWSNHVGLACATSAQLGLSISPPFCSAFHVLPAEFHRLGEGCEPCGLGLTPDVSRAACVLCPAGTISTGNGLCGLCPPGLIPNPSQVGCICPDEYQFNLKLATASMVAELPKYGGWS